ncbi:putative alpha/beta hydrolase family protein DUF2235 [Actinomycetospora succinea]|uniref:Putative alpha/beta hydrolase family protein DUF2235 n=1 Tax=Actinomycetospora succinea TaxID=663603 RepID=A0A4R6UYW8_9PSEU|nr:DUF2235 domain-containing protein [Actinomycetospora succinea]TDQ48874.1 putative alpha/beta hydrolase family protein DUF2235 [Actinomycetospora succinea]
MKRLVVCCDGTWNSPDEMDADGLPVPTNVSMIARAVAETDAEGHGQRVFYDKGVGTAGRLDRITGGAFGAGVSRNVLAAYRFLIDTYEPGDEIFFFGFSRGAFTARSTAGFVHNCGILRREYEHHLDDAFALYRSRAKVSEPRRLESELFRRSFSHEPRIRFIGVFDTVGALGIPVTGVAFARLVNRRFRFHDTDLSSRVDGAFHALAMHERRGSFPPTLWTLPSNAPADAERHRQELEQVWFTGVHSDVGGGYGDRELADITLLWMISRARRFGLALTEGSVDDTGPDALGPRHNSLRGIYRLLPRDDRTPADGQRVASSAVDRQTLEHDAPSAFAAILDDPTRVTEVEHIVSAPASLAAPAGDGRSVLGTTGRCADVVSVRARTGPR